MSRRRECRKTKEEFIIYSYVISPERTVRVLLYHLEEGRKYKQYPKQITDRQGSFNFRDSPVSIKRRDI